MIQTTVGSEAVISTETAFKSEHDFLSAEWTHAAVKLIQGLRAKDEEFRKLTSAFTLSLLYLITDLPPQVEHAYGGSQLYIFVRLDKGTVRKLEVGTERPKEKIDFTVASNYAVVKKIFLGELNAASSFIGGQIKVEPLTRIYQRPKFTAKAVITGNRMLKIAREVPTVFPPES